MSKIPLARYIFQRLRQYGVDHVHGVPGDNLLQALDHIAPAGSRWVGCCNELNAAYAADGYARVRGVGAVFTTMGVGELSAANAVAGSQAERVPVVHLVGVPSRASMAAQGIYPNVIHHSLQPGGVLEPFREIGRLLTQGRDEFRSSASVYGEVTAGHFAATFDSMLRRSFVQSKTMYFPLRADLVDVGVDSSWLEKGLDDGEQGLRSIDEENILKALREAKQPVILVDRGLGIDGLKDEINELVRISGIPTFCMPSGAGMVDNSLPNYHGVHSGPFGRIDSMDYVNSSDLVLTFGPMFSDTNTFGWRTVPKASAGNPNMKLMILASNTTPPKRFSTSSTNPVTLENITKETLRRAIEMIKHNPIRPRAARLIKDWRDAGKPKALHADEPITQTDLYDKLSTYLRPHDTILLGNATPLLGARDFFLPEGARVIASGQWFSIGHMLPAALGVALAKRGLEGARGRGRTILLDGDGSFQVTAQELSTIIAQRLDVTVFVFNNGGYAYERLIHGPEEEYNDIAPWRYLDLPRAFGADRAREKFGYETQTHAVRTWGELDVLLADDKFCSGPGLKMVELLLGRNDVPERFQTLFRGAQEEPRLIRKVQS
ncbi:uncharacterized protein PgNI_03590 [Pyricularia grisea]|uniref:Pyruvate decarboxylase n=1 Tax=Pyricularia grisea TaxID=148305 RepID=A0A6P8BAX4_PYRGI|nr:uncharacterized protein PgNI_03590 [Pyricularia grisea]TLD12938.1 hypothetical protein PgNI_03590 [Pyricularia grisea]